MIIEDSVGTILKILQIMILDSWTIQLPKITQYICMCFEYSPTYHQQQNIFHRKGVNLSFSKLQSILTVVNLFVHNNMTTV